MSGGHHSSLKWDRYQRSHQDSIPGPASESGPVLGLVLGPVDRSCAGPRTKPRSWDQHQSQDRSWKSTFCAFGRVPHKLSLIPITSSCIPRRSPLQEAGRQRVGGFFEQFPGTFLTKVGWLECRCSIPGIQVCFTEMIQDLGLWELCFVNRVFGQVHSRV